MRRVTVIVFLVEVGRQVDSQITRRFEAQCAARAALIGIVDVATRILVDTIAVAIVADHRKPGLNAVGQRAAQRCFDADAAIIADGQIDIAAGRVGRRIRDDVDRTARCVATIERALRTAQHFDAIHVEKRTELRAWAADIDAVDMIGDAPFSTRIDGVEANAANRDPRRAAIGRSEEHTSELQSLMRISYAVFCLKKKKHITYTYPTNTKHSKITTT